MTEYAYETFDVFTDTRFGGNPLAVLSDARGLDDAQMQAIAAEFNYSETTFVLPPSDPRNTAQVRIFTPAGELPFAGHPNVGTAVALARQGRDRDGVLRFEEAAGLVDVRVTRNPQGVPVAARLEAPQPLRIGAQVDAVAIAACAGLEAAEIVATTHGPVTAGLGTDFVIAEVTAEALARAEADTAAHRALVVSHPALAGRLSLSLYAIQDETSVRVRNFAPLHGITEDPATGSAAVALTALLLERRGGERLALKISQGTEMGRPSLLDAEAWRTPDGIRAAVAGGCLPVMRGVLVLS